MANREWPLRYQCKHEGCPETVTYRYSTQRDLRESWQLRNYGAGKGWLCLRHSNPDRVLSATNPETRFEAVSEEKGNGRYFPGGQGLMTGPGFLLYANDLPAGTKLIVTARIELPADTQKDKP